MRTFSRCDKLVFYNCSLQQCETGVFILRKQCFLLTGEWVKVQVASPVVVIRKTSQPQQFYSSNPSLAVIFSLHQGIWCLFISSGSSWLLQSTTACRSFCTVFTPLTSMVAAAMSSCPQKERSQNENHVQV